MHCQRHLSVRFHLWEAHGGIPEQPDRPLVYHDVHPEKNSMNKLEKCVSKNLCTMMYDVWDLGIQCEETKNEKIHCSRDNGQTEENEDEREDDVVRTRLKGPILLKGDEVTETCK